MDVFKVTLCPSFLSVLQTGSRQFRPSWFCPYSSASSPSLPFCISCSGWSRADASSSPPSSRSWRVSMTSSHADGVTPWAAARGVLRDHHHWLRSLLTSPHLASPLVSFPRCVRDVRGHHLHRDESGRWRRATVWLRIRASLGGFPSLPHQRPHLYRPEEERMREGAEGKRGGVVRIPLRTTSHSAYCPQTIDWHPNNTTKLHVPLIILNTKWRNVFLLGVFSLKQNSVSIMLPSHAENDHSCLLEQRCHHKLPVVTSKCV